jgi:hypothetical protein
MNPYAYEDAAWQRIKDLQREMENRRLLAAERAWPLVALVGLGSLGARLGRAAWNLPLGRFHRRYREAELATRPSAVGRWLETPAAVRAARSRASLQCDEQIA